MKSKLLALIPARGGSKGLPGKNIRSLVGIPLIAHSILLAKSCPEIDRLVVSTDDDRIADVAREYGSETPFIRPSELAQDETPMWPVVRHALQTVEETGEIYSHLLLLDPTSPGRFPEDIRQALFSLEKIPEAHGIVGCSEPEFNPLWNCVVEKNGWMENWVEAGKKYERRQDVPTVYRINASLYIWKTDFIRLHEGNWREGKHLIYKIPESRGMHIDSVEELERAEWLIKHRKIRLPWLEKKE